jgi:hypothetical protein
MRLEARLEQDWRETYSDRHWGRYREFIPTGGITTGGQARARRLNSGTQFRKVLDVRTMVSRLFVNSRIGLPGHGLKEGNAFDFVPC